MNSVEQAQLDAAKKFALMRILDKDATERLGRIRVANPTLTSQLEAYLLQLYQIGQLNETITDKKLKDILNVLVEKRKTTIIRK